MHVKYTHRSFVFWNCCLLFTLNAYGQHPRSNHSAYKAYYSGCWETGKNAGGLLITRQDGSFTLIKPQGSGRADTFAGTWKIRSVFSIPFKTDIIVFKFNNGEKQKYEIGVMSRPAVIYRSGRDDFYQVPCL